MLATVLTMVALSSSAISADAPQPAPNAGALSDSKKEADAAKDGKVVGKEAVISRLEKLFKSSPKPVINDRKLEPEPPYVKIVEGKDGRASIFYRCRFVKSKTIVDALESVVSNSGSVEDSPDQNIIVINDLASKVDDLKGSLLSLDTPLPQVLVETQIVEVYLEQGTEKDVKLEYTKFDADKNLTSAWGYNLDAPAQNPATNEGTGFDFYPYSSGSLGGDQKSFNLAVRWLASSRDAKILSAPNMVVDLGTTASMVTGEDVPIQSTSVTSGTVTTSISYKRIGVKLNVTPTLINNDIVQLEINPEVSSIIRYEAFVQNDVTANNPVVGIRNVKTRLSASDGEIIMLGGLYSSETTDAERKIPVIGDIPVLGEMFNGKETKNIDKQLIFFMKIHILPRPDSMLLDPEARAVELRSIGDAIHGAGALFPNRPPTPVMHEIGEGSTDKPKN